MSSESPGAGVEWGWGWGKLPDYLLGKERERKLIQLIKHLLCARPQAGCHTLVCSLSAHNGTGTAGGEGLCDEPRIAERESEAAWGQVNSQGHTLESN